jgi:hypothetical protein
MTEGNRSMIPAEPMFPARQQPTSTAMAEAQQTRAMAEVQSAMVIAKRFPRDEAASYSRIMQACQRQSLAERAVYAYPRGGEMVTGPSIRLAEAMAQAWGNIDFGIIELEQTNGSSSMMAYCWDMETNARQTRQFLVPHERHTRQGSKSLTDPRDIYELTANQGARRLRACILGVIPGDVTDAAVNACEQTMAKGGGEPIADRIRKMLAAFVAIGVTQTAIERRLGHKLDATGEAELVRLRQIFASIRDGMATAADCFPPEPLTTPTSGNPLVDAVAPKKAKKPEPSPFLREVVAAADRLMKRMNNEMPDWLPDHSVLATLDEAGLSALLDRINVALEQPTGDAL